jgi:peptidoglycan L-alanyl-D-glutamate endopeptidase CwlK
MYKFSDLSKRRMDGVDELLKSVVYEALKVSIVDFGIAWRGGVRTAEQQNELYKQGRSYKDGYEEKSKHQSGKALDILPYIDGQAIDLEENRHYYYILIGVIMSTAKRMEINLRSGANWDQNEVWSSDQKLNDLPHFELM